VGWDNNIPVINWRNVGKYFNQYVIVKGIDTHNSGGACFLILHTDQQTHFEAARMLLPS
jgi:hypothetical protein